MSKRHLAGAILALIIASAMVVYAYRRWSGSESSPRSDLLAQMPANTNAVLYIDLDALRQSPFLAALYKWAPQAKADADYSQFLQSTGFNYETDLNRVCIAFLNHGQDATIYAVADGRFDRTKISAYATQNGIRESRNGQETFSVPLNGGTRRVTFTFLRKDRVALTNGPSLDLAASAPRSDSDPQAWRERFSRLAGSPVFAVVRQDSASGATLSAEAHGGIQSPQLAALLDQLQWITVAGKPEGDRLRVVLEGEGTPAAPTRQLSDMLNGLLVLAQVGLSNPKMRQQLQPDVREAYLETLKSADVSQIDRGDTKSVRLIFDLTPKFLDAARTALPIAPPAPENKVPPSKRLGNKSTIRN
jgi:hypothetical protein